MSIRFKSLSTAPFEVIECAGVLGDTYHATLEKSCRLQDHVGVSLYVQGQIKVTRTAGVPNGDGQPYVWNPGGFSQERALPPILSPGMFRFEVVSESALYYCVRRADKAAMGFELVRSPIGSVLHLPQGQRLFVAGGAVDLGGAELQAPRLIYAASGDRELTVKRDVFGLVLRD